MDKILLIIKAETFSQAKLAARSRGIHLSDLCAMKYKSFWARTEKTNIVPVQKWYHEEQECRDGYGYPIGTLLFFRN